MSLALDNQQSTIGKDGNRVWLYPQEIRGYFYHKRQKIAWLLLTVYLALPWMVWNGNPLFKADILNGQLVLFGASFYPADLPVFAPLILSLGILVFAVTSLWGRIWCGWACPQTVFLQFFFEPIERWIEGTAAQRKKRDALAMSPNTFFRKLLKHGLFLFFSAIIANTCLAYFWGIDNVMAAITRSPSEHWGAFLFMVADSLLFYWIFTYFKEQACIIVCPYARFQSVLTDDRTLNIEYNEKRGEKRGKPSQAKELGPLGDCVSCGFCVRVCPTGIDIREGMQLECIGCAKCIDACDSIMKAWKREPKLISYASQDGQGISSTWRRPRVLLYTSLILVLWTVFAVLIFNRSDTTTMLVRKGAVPYFAIGVDSIANVYSLDIRNKSGVSKTFTLRSENNLPGHHSWSQQGFTVGTGEIRSFPLTLVLDGKAFVGGRYQGSFYLSDGKHDVKIDFTALGPMGM